MLRIQILCISLACLVGMQTTSYGNTKDSISTKRAIAGRFVNYTFLDQTPYSTIGNIRVWCYEMNFIAEDRVAIKFVGWEGPDEFAYRKDGDHYRILDAGNKDKLLFTLNQDGSITLIDSTAMGRSLNSIFRRVDSKISLSELINQRTAAGEYTLYDKKGDPTKQKVVFMPNGEIAGLKKYTKYSICYSGDCVEMPLFPINTIDLYPDNYKKIRYKDGGFTEENSPVTYAFIISSMADKRLMLFKLGPGPKDSKGEMPIEELVFDLRLLSN